MFPIVGENCRINLHWDGIDLSTLHIQSVIPDNYILVQRKTTDGGVSGWPISSVGDSNGEATLCLPKPSLASQSPALPVATPFTRNTPNGTSIYSSIKNEHVLRNGNGFSGQDSRYCTNVNSTDDVKLSTEPRIIITRNGENNLSGTVSLLSSNKQLPSIRAKPSSMEQPAPLLLPTPPDMTPHPLCLPQAVSASSIIPLVPVVTYLQPQMTLGQVNTQSSLLPSAIPITQMQPMQAFHQISVPACTAANGLLQSPPTYTMQPLTVSVPVQPARFQLSGRSHQTKSSGASSMKKIVRGSSQLQNQMKIEPSGARSPPPANRQVRVTAKKYPSAGGTQLLIKGGQVVLKSGGQIGCKRPSSEPHQIRTGQHVNEGANSIIRTRSPRHTKVSIVAYGQDDEPPIVYPALGSQPLEKLFDTL